MALETSPESPAQLRTIVTAIEGWVAQLGAVWIEAQVTQLRHHRGMVYLTLRDTAVDFSMDATCHRSVVDALAAPLVDGASVVVHAKPSVYAQRGKLQLSVREIRPVGLGDLLARLEQRRRLLAAEGLFAPELKRPLPFLPALVGLVTARDSAAERDVLENARRRWPAVRFRVEHATMQGAKSALEVIAALQRLDADPEVDVVIVARGGGSVEDLLPFSDEALIRAVYAVTTPVVSAIGHEPDAPILDLVADVRASTPTDAAKMVVPDVTAEQHLVATGRARLRAALGGWLTREQALLDALRSRPALADPRSLVDDRLAEVAQLRDRARRTMGHRLDRAADDIRHHRARAQALSPLETLRRGYAVVQDAEGHVIASVAAVAEHTPISVRVADGRIHATTTSETSETSETRTEETDGEE